MKRINIKTLFIRFLKEQNQFALVKQIVKGFDSTITKELIIYSNNKTTVSCANCRFKHIIQQINDKSVTEGNKTKTPLYLETEWRNFLLAHCFKKEVEREFIKFLKKRGTYEDYKKNFSAEYAEGLKICWQPGLMKAYGAKWNSEDTIKEWTDIKPLYYLKLGIKLNDIKDETKRKKWWKVSSKWDNYLTNFITKKEKEIMFYIE